VFRIGLVGAGHISFTHAQAFARLDDCEVVGVCSPRSAERFGAKLGLDLATDDLDALLERVDVACINTPNALHAEQAIRAAEAGCHVIVEKPLASTAAEGRRVVEACRDAGVGLAYAEELPFVPKFARMKEMVAAGAIGAVRYMTQREAHAGPYSPWFFSRDEAAGGVLMDMACHSVECVRWFLGKPACTSVWADLRAGREDSVLEDHGVLHLSFEGGVTATCEASWVLQGGMQSTLEAWGSEGTLAADLLHETGLRLWTREGHAGVRAAPGWTTHNSDWLDDNGYPQEMAHFLDCFDEGRVPDESGEDGVVVLEILEAAYESARLGRSVSPGEPTEPVERAVDRWLGPPDSSRPSAV
jgi:myo-inositol 2-dehydrogenase/D-chiro-inositol 1-dehydrogenase